MKCPNCSDKDLLITERQGIEIDYCPACRGVWLDRGELDKIIERSTTVSTHPPASYSYERRDHDYDDEHHGGHGRRRQWFADLFD